MTFASISPAKRSALIATFIGLHVPLVGLTCYALISGLPALLPVLLVTLISTLAGVAGTLYALFRILDLETEASDMTDRFLTNA